MPNNTEHCCLSCGKDISDKRIDAKYCSDRCRMRYRRGQKKDKLIEELVSLFTQIPNHSVQRTDQWLLLQWYDATSDKTKFRSRSDLKRKSITHLKALIKEKRWLLVAEKAKQIWR